MPEIWTGLSEAPRRPDPAALSHRARPAGVFRRLFAALIDWGLVSLLYGGFVALGVWGASLGARSAGARFLSTDLVAILTGPFTLLWLALGWVYVAWFTRYGGQTPGKMLFRIRVVTVEGDEPTWGQALLRPAGYFLSWIPLGLGFVLAVFPPEKRALHDRLTGTRVIRTSGPSLHAGATLAAAAWVLASALTTPPASAALVERILAVVNGRLITLSDVVAYRTLSGVPDLPNEDAVRALVDRRLLLDEADRFAIPNPTASDIADREAAMIATLGGPDALARTLNRLGWGRDDLTAWIRDELRLVDFLNQRVYFFVIIPPQDIEAYYGSHREDFAGLPVEEAREIAEQRLVQERGDARRDQFVEGLRDKATIHLNPLE